MKFHLIFNPICCRNKYSDNDVKSLIDYARNKGIEIVCHKTEREGHATEIAKNLTSTDQQINLISFGGDGTIHEIINGIVNFAMTYIAILPVGSGNDFARSCGIDSKVSLTKMLDNILKYQVQKVDYLLLNDQIKVITSVSFGISFAVVKFRDQLKHFSPKFQYAYSSFRKSFFYKNFQYQISIDKKPYFFVTSPMITFANAQYLGCGLLIAPNANPSNGLVNVAIIKKFSCFSTLYVLLKLKKGKINKTKFYQSFEGKEIDLKFVKNGFEADGHIFEGYESLNIKVVPAKLNFYLPKKDNKK